MWGPRSRNRGKHTAYNGKRLRLPYNGNGLRFIVAQLHGRRNDRDPSTPLPLRGLRAAARTAQDDNLRGAGRHPKRIRGRHPKRIRGKLRGLLLRSAPHTPLTTNDLFGFILISDFEPYRLLRSIYCAEMTGFTTPNSDIVKVSRSALFERASIFGLDAN